MSHGDDDDDLQLKSLRAVWLDLPDEEPPERGLAELLAAARTKASEMSEPEPTPSMWQRFVALLRRPPMLALATVLILVGGIALLGGKNQKSSAPAISPASSGDESGTVKEEMAAPQNPPPAETKQAPVDDLQISGHNRRDRQLEDTRAFGGETQSELADTPVLDAGVNERVDETALKAGLAAPDRAATGRATTERATATDRATTIDSTTADPAQ